MAYHREKQNEYQRLRSRKANRIFRMKAIEMLGGKCAHCGFDKNYLCLQIDHIKPILRPTNRHTKAKPAGTNMCKYLVSGNISKEGLQLLCANCHAIKSYNERHTYKGFKNELVYFKEKV